MSATNHSSTITCPRCLFESDRPGMQFCPRCGLPDVQTAAHDHAPVMLETGGRKYRVLERIAIGDLCNVYRCEFAVEGRMAQGIAKIVRDARNNALLRSEASTLRRLLAADHDGRFGPFLPRVEESFTLRDEHEARQVNVLRNDEAIRLPGELYSLSEVRVYYTRGIDARDMAWIWRRLLSVLGFVHQQNVIHGAIVPAHVLIEPREHKLVLVDWCFSSPGTAPLVGRYRDWYPNGGNGASRPTAGLDIAMAARSMIDVLGGDPVDVDFPPTLDPALQRHFERCLSYDESSQPVSAWKLLDDFDTLIEALWGARQFRPFAMPARPKP